MDTAFLIVSIILIIGAELLYWKKSSRNTMITKGQRALTVIVALELAVAVLNTELPTAFITDDIQITDIPMNFLALYMRPVIFASLALIHRIWLDLHKAGSQKE